MTIAPASGAQPANLTATDLDRLRQLAVTSHTLITTAQQPSGAYPACMTFPAYAGYTWFRDGSFTAEGVSRFGDVSSADAFHDWCNGVLASQTDLIADLVRRAGAADAPTVAEMLPTRFSYAGTAGHAQWWDFQTDGYGTWLWAVVTHAKRHGRPLARWQAGIGLAVDYLNRFWDRPCYDWWEEHVEHHHVSTLAAIFGGLTAASESGCLNQDRTARTQQSIDMIRSLVFTSGIYHGHLTKWLGTDAVDGSLPACIVPFGLTPVGSELATATLAEVRRHLDMDLGVHRFRADIFYGGGQWPLLSALLGWNLKLAGDIEGAWQHLRWIANHANPAGQLPEQVPDHLLHSECRQEWLDRWGPVATPLLWSHGMYLILADELGLLNERAVLT